MKRQFSITCLVAIAFGIPVISAQMNTGTASYKNQVYSVKQLNEDFTLLRKALEDVHPALYKFSNKPSLDSLFDITKGQIGKEMTEADFWTLIAPVISKIKCGHTRIYPSDHYREYYMSKAKVFPFDVKILDNKLFIAKNLSPDSTILIGTEIMSINNIPATKIIGEFFSRSWADGNNQTMRFRFIEDVFSVFYALEIGESDIFLIDAIAPKTYKRLQLKIPSVTMTERKKYTALRANKLNNKQLIQLKFVGDQTNSAILTIRSFDKNFFESKNIDFNHFIDSSFSEILKKHTRKLIIDLRNNNGGDPSFVRYLYSYLAEKEFNLLNYAEFKINKPVAYLDKDTSDFYKFITDKRGKFLWKDEEHDWYGTYQPNRNNYKGVVYLMVDGGSFSSSGFFCSLFKYYNRGKIVGEESGGFSECNDCHDNLILPNTRLHVEIPRCTFTMNLPGLKYEGHGVIPDKIVTLKVEDLINGNDPMLEILTGQNSCLNDK